jgi:hypothetical protein
MNRHKLNRHALWALHILAILNDRLVVCVGVLMNIDRIVRVIAIKGLLDLVIILISLGLGLEGFHGGWIHVIVTAIAAKLGDNVDKLGLMALRHFARSRVPFKVYEQGFNFLTKFSNFMGHMKKASPLFIFV